MITVRSFDPSVVTHLTIAGWTGRNQEALEKHIRELEELGVPRPASTPIFYRVAASLLTTRDAVEVLGDASSGEAEPVIVALDGDLWVGVGSDHTDRKAETMGVTLSKQLCAKPVSAQLWRFADVADRWDDLELRSYAVTGGQRSLYQEGTLRSMRPPMELLQMSGRPSMPDGAAMFCGTLAVHGGIRPADRFEVELKDPKTGQTLQAAYAILPLPNLG